MNTKLIFLIPILMLTLILIIACAVKGKKKFHKQRKFTEADKDLILLIKNISAIYDKVDK